MYIQYITCYNSRCAGHIGHTYCTVYIQSSNVLFVQYCTVDSRWIVLEYEFIPTTPASFPFVSPILQMFIRNVGGHMALCAQFQDWIPYLRLLEIYCTYMYAPFHHSAIM